LTDFIADFAEEAAISCQVVPQLSLKYYQKKFRVEGIETISDLFGYFEWAKRWANGVQC